MNILIFTFWLCIGILVYTYLGYGIIISILVKLKKTIFKKIKTATFNENQLPDVTMVVAAYNEENCIRAKIENSLQLDYPQDKLHLVFVTDGSDDQTPEIINKFPKIKLFHKNERAGKIAAVNRAMNHVNTPITIFSDANTVLNPKAIINIVNQYKDENVGAVSGEKRVWTEEKDKASAAGESLYWKYESFLKKQDSELNTVVGAAGELFSVRTELYEPINRNTIIEDFCLTLNIAKKGFKVAYEPNAYAIETGSQSVAEEMKRKIRIASGGFQAIVKLKTLLNPFKYGMLTFQYVSHRVMRWTLAPIALILLLISHLFLFVHGELIFQFLFYPHIAFYFLSFIGWVLQEKKIKIKIFFIPYYFIMMNLCVFKGFIRFIKKTQSVVWEKSARIENDKVIQTTY